MSPPDREEKTPVELAAEREAVLETARAIARQSSGNMEAVREPPRPPRPDGRYGAAAKGTPIAKVSKAMEEAHPLADEFDGDSDPGRLSAVDIKLPEALLHAHKPESLPPNATPQEQERSIIRWTAVSVAQLGASFERHRDNQAEYQGEVKGEFGNVHGHVGAVETQVAELKSEVVELKAQFPKTARAGHYFGLATGACTLLAALIGLVVLLIQAHHTNPPPPAPPPAVSAHR